MTWIGASIAHVRCDDPAHRGVPEHDLAFGGGLSALQALVTDGWRYEHATQRHQCPLCVRRKALRN